MKKSIGLVTLIFILTITCCLLTFKMTAETGVYLDRDYLIYYKNFSSDGENEKLMFPIPQMPDKYLFNYVELYRPLYDFYNKNTREGYRFYSSTAQYASNKYLSIETIYMSGENNRFSSLFRVGLTIDLENGKTISLDDLLEISPEFIRLLKEGKLAKTDFEVETGDITDFSDWDDDKVVKELNICSLPFTTDNYIHDFRGVPLFKPTFFLAPGKIYFANFDGYGHLFYINLSDITSFLKVDIY